MRRALMWAFAAGLAIGSFVLPAIRLEASEPGSWRLLSDPGPAPPTISVPLGVYDPVRHRVLVVESNLVSGSPPVQVHVFTPEPEPHWSTLAVSGTPPPIRLLSSLMYDPIRDRLVLFGGWGMNDLWALTLSGQPTWQSIATNGTPPPVRAGHSASYDPVNDRMIVFGGYATGPPPANLTYYSDAWALSLQSNTWSALAPSGMAPAAREGHSAIYDPGGQRLLIFAGHHLTGFWNDLWALSLGDSPGWSELQVAGPVPPARSAHGAIYDPIRRRMWIHSGVNAQRGVEPDEVWCLSLTGEPAWTAIATIDTLLGRSYPVDVYDPLQDRLLACGGARYSQTSSLPLAGPYQWSQILPPRPLLEPGPRTGHALVHDTRRDRFLALGGTFGNTDSKIWRFAPEDSVHWSPINTPTVPTGWSLAAVYDSLGDRIIVYDGVVAWSIPPGGASAWTQLGSGAPSPRSGASIALDTRRNRLIVYGGIIFYPHSGDYTVSDIWSLSLGPATEWTLLGYGPHPYGSTGHASFYDPLLDRLVIMGGSWRNGRLSLSPYGASVWSTPLDSTLRWTLLTSPIGTQPLAPPASQVVYDPHRNRILVFADSTAWTRSVDDTGPWTVLDTSKPGPVVKSSVVFDPARDQVLALFASGRGTDADQAWALSLGPLSMSLLRSSASLESVELVWRSNTAIGREATVERRELTTEWAALSRIQFDVTGTAVFIDRSVTLGAHYVYRVGIREGDAVWYSDSILVEMPARPGLALLGTRPNPAVGSFGIRFSLPDNAPARLEVFDVRGRRCMIREVGNLGVGTHAIQLDSRPSLAPGVYLVRLQRAGQASTVRAVVLR